MAAAKLAQQAKARYEAYIGYCYGKKKDSGRGKPKMYQELAGKQFWTELTGDEEFYIKIINFMGTMPEQYVASYKESYNKAANRLIREFSNSFCKEDGSIDWEKLVEFNSGDWNIFIENKWLLWGYNLSLKNKKFVSQTDIKFIRIKVVEAISRQR